MAAAAAAIKKNADRKRKAAAKEEAARARANAEEAEWQETTGTAPAPAPPVTPQRVEVDVPQPDDVGTTHGSGFFYFQPQARAMYEGNTCQVTVALIISANFLANVTEKEIDPQGVNYPGMWRMFELTFNVIFLIELIVNMYARWLWVFWCDGWNIFDVVVVAVGCVSFGAEVRASRTRTSRDISPPFPRPAPCALHPAPSPFTLALHTRPRPRPHPSPFALRPSPSPAQHSRLNPRLSPLTLTLHPSR